MSHHPKPTWFKLAEFFFPDRCREIPEAQNPDRIVLRQFALVKRHAYVQQFASSEDPSWAHSHQWKYTVALGLRGSYLERRLAGPPIVREAPYLYGMGSDVVHNVSNPSPDHLSVFVGFFRDDDLKVYMPIPAVFQRPWHQHVLCMVKRI